MWIQAKKVHQFPTQANFKTITYGTDTGLMHQSVRFHAQRVESGRSLLRSSPSSLLPNSNPLSGV